MYAGRMTPARAGTTHDIVCIHTMVGDDPRSRGDDAKLSSADISVTG